MKKHASDAEQILNALGKLTGYLNALGRDIKLTGSDLNRDAFFNDPLEIIRQTLLFDISVLYKVSNVINDRLILEVIKVVDPDGSRMDLKEGRKLRLFLDARDKRYVNEVNAFLTKKISHINVSGMGCDIMGYVYFPEDFGGAYLVGGDFLGKESATRDFEISAMKIMCNLLSTVILKTRFKHKAEYDDLTGLYNSGKIKEEVGRIIKRFKRKPDSSAALIMADIDFFKPVNDSYGHIQGDTVLKEVGAIISNSMREYFDVAGRYGGEEFLMIFDDTDSNKAMEIAERIRKTIESYGFPMVNRTGRQIKGKSIRVTMSFGVAPMTGAEELCTANDWIAKADNALYRSKQNGRNQTTLFSQGPGIS